MTPTLQSKDYHHCCLLLIFVVANRTLWTPKVCVASYACARDRFSSWNLTLKVSKSKVMDLKKCILGQCTLGNLKTFLFLYFSTFCLMKVEGQYNKGNILCWYRQGILLFRHLKKDRRSRSRLHDRRSF